MARTEVERPTGGDILWIRRFQPPAADSAVRLVCFPHAGGSASYYYSWSQALGPEVDVLAIQYPGRQDRRREPAVQTIGGLADQIADVVAGWIERPCGFFGHSMGAVLAFEVARRLQPLSRRRLLRLFASGRRAPSRYRHDQVHLLDDAALAAEVCRIGGTDPRLLEDEEVRDLVLPVIRNDYRAVETYSYRPGPPLACPITALVGDSDPTVTPDEAAAWAELSQDDFELRVFAGGHFFLDTCRTAVVDTVRSSLERSGSRRVERVDHEA